MQPCSRRDFLSIGTGFIATCLAPPSGLAALLPDTGARSLSFYHTHTGEHLTVRYFSNNTYRPAAMQQVNTILRDHRTGDIETIDPQLIDALYQVKRHLKTDDPFHIISGYRSPKTNAMLRKRGAGVAKSSYHMQGRAIDVRLPGHTTASLRHACIDLHCGGVGYYPRSDFVHMDTGAVRNWNG